MDIKLFHSGTYTNEIKQIRSELNSITDSLKKQLKEVEFLYDYMNDIMWKEDTIIGALHGKLMNCLYGNKIVLYHNTRLFNPDTIREKGLIFSDERYIDSLIETMKKADIDYRLIKEVVKIVDKEILRWDEGNGVNRRKNAVCYIYDMDYYERYNKFLAIYGGEFMEFGLSGATHNNLARYKDIVRIGKPYVVEFSVLFDWFSQFERMDIARYMIEEWIHLDIIGDEVAHQYDGWIEKEIPPQNIIDIHLVDDNFHELNRYFNIE